MGRSRASESGRYKSKDECRILWATMQFDDYKVVLYRQQDGSWVAEIPAISGCYALMPTREAALAELSGVFQLIAEEYREKGLSLPSDTTEIVNA
jgi:predicted RNase H-like HicB family nuclease